MIINDYCTGLYIYYAILVIVILKCPLSIYKKSLLYNGMPCYAAAAHTSCVYHVP